MSDLGSHLRIIVAPEEDNAKDGTLSQLTKSTFSMNAGKPVMFVLDGGARTEFWTKGFSHCPWDAAVRIRTPKRESYHYFDSDGIGHRIGGPAESSYVLDSGMEQYEEIWRVNGNRHREDGPAYTSILRAKPNKETWGGVVTLHDWDQYFGKFPDSTPVKYTTSIDTAWCRDGLSYRANKKPAVVQETGVVEVMQISELLGVKTTRLCVRQEFNWMNEKGNLSRGDGPAVIKLLGSYEVTENGKVVESTYESMIANWWFDGQPFKDAFIDGWMKENNIVPGNAPYINNSFFANSEDEVCFIMDVLSDQIPN